MDNTDPLRPPSLIPSRAGSVGGPSPALSAADFSSDLTSEVDPVERIMSELLDVLVMSPPKTTTPVPGGMGKSTLSSRLETTDSGGLTTSCTPPPIVSGAVEGESGTVHHGQQDATDDLAASAQAEQVTYVSNGSMPWEQLGPAPAIQGLLGTGPAGKAVFGHLPYADEGSAVVVRRLTLNTADVSNTSSPEYRRVHGSVEEILDISHEIGHTPHLLTYCGCQFASDPDSPSRVQLEAFMSLPNAPDLRSLIPLTSIMKNSGGKLGVVQARASIRAVVMALGAIHAAGHSHNDVTIDRLLWLEPASPHNEGQACIGYFGKTPLLLPPQQNVTEAMAPRLLDKALVFAPEGEQGPAADIWSVGCLVIEMFGKNPWTVQGTNLFQVMFHIAQAKTMPNGVPDKYCPPSLMEFFEKCFDRDPTKRATATDLLESKWLTCPDAELEEPQHSV